MKRNIVCDLGNTLCKLAIFEGSSIINRNHFENLTETELNEFMNPYKLDGSIISSVINQETFINSRLSKEKNFINLSKNTKLPIAINYKTPETLGNDRIANAVAANSLFPDTDVLVIDCGTCIKYDFVTERNVYQGGAISPGLKMRFKALHDYTQKLPLIEDAENFSLIGKSTNESIISGVMNGMINEMDGFIEKYNNNYKNLTVILTGGDITYFDKAFKKPIFAHSFLTLLGLNEILLFNQK
jgi:type III pantothenate kinase